MKKSKTNDLTFITVSIMNSVFLSVQDVETSLWFSVEAATHQVMAHIWLEHDRSCKSTLKRIYLHTGYRRLLHIQPLH